MTVHVLDASAMVAYITAELGGSVVRSLLLDSRTICYAHSVNLCEVYYDIIRRGDANSAKEAVESLFADGVIERQDMSRQFWQKVGKLKSRGRISIADCFAIAFAQELSGEVVTANHHEFDPLVPLGIVPIQFIR